MQTYVQQYLNNQKNYPNLMFKVLTVQMPLLLFKVETEASFISLRLSEATL